jgi:hypothetical protein
MILWSASALHTKCASLHTNKMHSILKSISLHWNSMLKIQQKQFTMRSVDIKKKPLLHWMVKICDQYNIHVISCIIRDFICWPKQCKSNRVSGGNPCYSDKYWWFKLTLPKTNQGFSITWNQLFMSEYLGY